MQGMYVGIKTFDGSFYRVDCRRSLIQKGFKDEGGKVYFVNIPSANIRQCVESLKAVSQLSFKDSYTNKVFEIEMSQLNRNVEILVTDLTNAKSRLLEESEYKSVLSFNWNGLFNEKGDLTISSIFEVYPDTIHNLCELSKEIISIGALFYIKNSGIETDMRIKMSQLIELIIEFDKVIAEVVPNENTPFAIYNWFLQGCPINNGETIPDGSNEGCCPHYRFNNGCNGGCFGK